MRFRLYREYGALNSRPVFDAVEQGLRSSGHEIVNDGEDVPVIWSVLWSGRMASNKKVYDNFIRKNKNVLIVEVGNFFRGKTWRISLNNINRNGIFGNSQDLDQSRPSKLNVNFESYRKNRNSSILIATQHDKSLQWEGQLTPNQWVSDIVFQIRRYSDRPVVIRPHPRCRFSINLQNVTVQLPKPVPGTYDDFDIDYNFHCVINHNSGPAVQAAIKGVPVICDSSSLAYPVSDKLENIENISLPDRDQWFLELCHTEWTLDEISQGIPFIRIFK